MRLAARAPYPGAVFESVGWGEILVLVVAGLFILGPERLPSAAAWLGKTMRQVREYATGARDQLRRELGPEFDELRKPLEDLRGCVTSTPRNVVRRTLLDADPDPGHCRTVTPSNGSPVPLRLGDPGRWLPSATRPEITRAAR